MKEQYDSSKEKTKLVEALLKSRSVCLAKWYHANIYLQTGETHSCYHPSPHSINPKQIQKNPAALHNTDEKLKERRQMLSGERPKGCQYCWNIEDLGDSLISDRHVRTGSLYSEARVQELLQKAEHSEVIPDYIEVSFGNECNFRCGYCHPKASSRYYNEIKEFGPYSMSKNHRCDIDWFKIYKEENNPFLEAWWAWWAQIQDQIKILRITGGEPLIQQSTYRLLDSLSAQPKPFLELNINSNMGSAEAVIRKFCGKVQNLLDQGSIQKFKLFTSLDTWGPQAEYIRNGLKLDLFERNLKTYLETTESPVTFMMTFNIFSVPNFDRLLEKVLEWRSQYSWARSDQFHRIRFDISYLKEPLQYDIQILPKAEFVPQMERHLQFIKDHLDDSNRHAFSFMEYENFRRIVEYMKSTPYPEAKIAEGRKDFIKFFEEMDRRRNTDLPQTFPELKDFIKLCQNQNTSFLDLFRG
jgi:organic radical activating enzyme